MLICIGCEELNPFSNKQVHTYATKSTQFRVFETITGEIRDVSYEEMFANLHSTRFRVVNLEIKDNKIKGNGIDIAKFYLQSNAEGVIFNKVVNIQNQLVGYDIVFQNGTVEFVQTNKLRSYLGSGKKVINAAITTDGIRLTSLSGIDTRVMKNSEFNNSQNANDISIDTQLDPAIRILRSHNFKCGYTKSYKIGTKSYLIAIYYRGSTVIWTNINIDGTPRMFNSPGGRVIIQGKDKANNGKVYRSKFLNDSNNCIVFNTSEDGLLRKIDEIENSSESVTCFLDMLGEIPEEMMITSLDLVRREKELRSKYFELRNDIGRGYIIYLFILNEFGNFDIGLKSLFRHLRKYSRQMLQEKIASDIRMLGDSHRIKKYLAELLKLFRNIDFNYKQDVEPFIGYKNRKTSKGIKGFLTMFRR